jgi:hypothetical protein
MLFSLIHTETGSSSRFRHFAFEAHRLIQSLFGYFHHNPSLMEACEAISLSVRHRNTLKGTGLAKRSPD